MIHVIKINNSAEIDRFAMAAFCMVYDELQHIPEFKVRIDTAKEKTAEVLNFIDEEIFIDSITLIQNTKFYEDEKQSN